MMILNNLKKRPAILAVLLCMYYILPKYISVAFELLFLLVLLNDEKIARNRSASLPIKWYAIFFVCMVLVNVFRIEGDAILYLTTCINNLIFIILVYNVIQTKNDVIVFVKAFGGIGFFFCLFLIPSIIITILSAGGRLGSNVREGGNEFLADSISLGYILTIINLCQFYCTIESKNTKRLLFLLFYAFSFFCILLTGTRKTLLAVILCLALYFIIKNRKSLWKLVFYFSIGAIAILVVYKITLNVEFLYHSIGYRLEGLIGYFNSDYAEVDQSTLAREELIKRGMDIFYENPLVGLGVNESMEILEASHPHNNYLSLLDFGGIIVFFAYYWFYLKIYLNYLKMKKYTNVDIVLLGVIVSQLLVDYAATTYNIIFFPTFISVIYINSLYKNRKLLNYL